MTRQMRFCVHWSTRNVWQELLLKKTVIKARQSILRPNICMLLLLDGRHRLMKEILLSKGTANSSWVPVRTIFVEALRYEAVYMILIHNHPSGCPEPSREDLVITKQIKEAGELLGIPLSDHIIIGDKCYTSLREQQMM
mgnify:CR=1 FL=1